LLHQQQEANDTTHENEEDHWRVADRTPTKDAATTISKKRVNKFDAFASKVQSYSKTYRKAYKHLKFRSRLSRIDECVAQIVACCIDKEKLENQGIRYIEKDEDLANECLNIVNSIRERLALKMKMDLPMEVEPIPLVDGDEEEKEKGLDLETAMKILSESTGNGYERVRKELKKKLPAKHTDKLKSLYLLKKDLPLKVESVTYSCDDGRSLDSRREEVDDLIYGFGNFVKTEEEALQLLSSGSEEVVHGAKLEGGMVDWIDGMVKKLEKKGNEIGDDDDVIVLSCFDGAEAIRSEKQVKGVISFSSLLLTPKLVNEEVLLAGSSFNILTWMQILGKEELAVMKPCLMEYFNDRRELFERRSKPSLLPNQNVCLYDMHDGKLLYLLSQHSMWNRKNHPFLLCKCKRNSNFSHDCSMWKDEEYAEKWAVSQHKWEVMESLPQEWSVDKHRNWCDEKNFGITHFGIEPKNLPVSSIRFDVFHLSCALIRKLMTTLRNFMLKQSSSLSNEFTDSILRTFLTEYLVYCWNNKLKFSSFKGNDLFTFLCHDHYIVDFLTERLIPTQEMTSICTGLQVLRRIVKFMTISRIDSTSSYEVLLTSFKEDVKKFYENGRSSYLGKPQDESFYVHCLCFYMPKIAELTFERHKVGLEIFTMQGFERRNKESKNTIQRFTTKNRKNTKALLNNNLQRLEMVYFYEMNAY